ncbi:23S rRNA (uracil-5-)-methyltransferase RumA [Vulcanibacillus modesticaldus]|uniref:23S rRNA (Uracil-5-)-methyltransferase RumA n=1 Tax=Vulcanibacillus modesticaldus TaxID=337097 RepID=A0A1D2YU60_9BACI|nr:23S rRNA (uracil(1939)-C(5))-methyltransferase RlmD [Vulcanibacillus modesticaldus]OEF99250.1 23S rRNA (uracil-5-)-methyltransferase RumA [Vulcanibacillus modesticaldus]
MEKVQIPVQKNQYIEMEFTGFGHDGEGVGKYQGYTLFVPGVLPGEKAKVKVIKVKKNYGYGRLIELIDTSQDRIEPKCSIYKQCGGCQLQHITYQEQLKQKRLLVEDNIKRIGKIEDVVIHQTLGMRDPWNYRNKSQVPVAKREGGLIAGFYAKRTHDVIDMKECLIQQEENNYMIQTVRRIAEEIGIAPYDEKNHQGILRHIVTRVGVNTGERMLILVTNGKDFPNKEELIKRIVEELPDLTSLIQNVNDQRTNVIMGLKSITLWGRDVIYDTIGDIKFAISPRSFYQVNPEQTKQLYDKALEYAMLTGNENVIDAYCGIGTISLFLAKKAKQVYGVEIVPEAIKDAKKNAELNGIKNVTFEVGAAETVIPKWQQQGLNVDVVVVDPPRKGCDQSLLQTIIELKPKRVVYVSCNPSTLARDLRILEDGGFKTIEIQPVDMFPQTTHVESVALLTLK